MVKCDYCGKEVALPFICPYCGGKFCVEHHLPENHNCPGLKILKQRLREQGTMFTLPYNSKEIPVNVRRRKTSIFERIFGKGTRRKRYGYQDYYSNRYRYSPRYNYTKGIIITSLYFFGLIALILLLSTARLP